MIDLEKELQRLRDQTANFKKEILKNRIAGAEKRLQFWQDKEKEARETVEKNPSFRAEIDYRYIHKIKGYRKEAAAEVAYLKEQLQALE